MFDSVIIIEKYIKQYKINIIRGISMNKSKIAYLIIVGTNIVSAMENDPSMSVADQKKINNVNQNTRSETDFKKQLYADPEVWHPKLKSNRNFHKKS